MLTLNPKYLTDTNGKKLCVVLPIEEYNTIIEELEALEDIRLYDEAIKEDDGKRIPLEAYIEKRAIKNA